MNFFYSLNSMLIMHLFIILKFQLFINLFLNLIFQLIINLFPILKFQLIKNLFPNLKFQLIMNFSPNLKLQLIVVDQEEISGSSMNLLTGGNFVFVTPLDRENLAEISASLPPQRRGWFCVQGVEEPSEHNGGPMQGPP